MPACWSEPLDGGWTLADGPRAGTAPLGGVGGISYHPHYRMHLHDNDSDVRGAGPHVASRAHARGRLLGSDDLSRRLVASANAGIAALDCEHRYVVFNPFMERLRGVRADDVIGKRPYDVFADLDRSTVAEYLDRALAGELVVVDPPAAYPQPDGTVRFGRSTIEPLRADDGAVVGAIATVRDVTDERHAAEGVHDREVMLVAIGLAARHLLERPLESAVPDALRALGEAVAASRCYVYRYVTAGDSTRASLVHEWCADGIPPDPWGPEKVMDTPGERSEWFRTLRSARALYGTVDEMPPGSRPMLRQAGIRSIASVPLLVAGEFWGEIGFDDCRESRVWSAAEIDGLFAVAQAFGGAIARSEADVELRRRDAILEAVGDAARVLLQRPLGESLPVALEALGEAVGASRASVYRYRPVEGGVAASLVHAWLAPSVRPDPWDSQRPIEGSGYEAVYDAVASGRAFHGIVRDLPPEQQVPLREAGTLSIAVTPIEVGGVLWGEVGFNDCVAERTWSAAEIEALYAAANVIGAAIERAQAEDGLRRRDAILEAVSAVARLLLAQPLELCAPRVLETLGRAAGASRAYVFTHEPRDGVHVAHHRFEWCAPGVAPHVWDDFVWEQSIWSSWFEALRRGEAVHGPVTGLSGAAGLAAAGIKSLADVPIFVAGTVWGDIGLDDCETERIWSAAELDALHTAAGVIGAAVERQRAEDALRRSNEMLQQSQRLEAVGRLAGGVAHDFNNLLTVIVGYAGLVLESLPSGHQEHHDVEEIRRAAERAVQLTGQLLAFSRRQVLQLRSVDVNDVVRETETMLKRLIGEDIDVVHDLTPGTLMVRADPMQLQQVLVNLAVNARDAMPNGGQLRIRTTRESASGAPGSVPGEAGIAVLEVADNGVGMDDATAAVIFEPFFTTKGPGRGTGLGLATVYGIVKQSGGNIALTTAPGAGSTFRVEFPACSTSDGPPPELPQAAARSGSETILVAEDEDTVRSLVVDLLGRSGYRVLAARDGVEAIEIAGEHEGPIDLLLTDVVMPRMSGTELVRRLRATRRELPVLYLSGYTGGAFGSRGDVGPDVPLLRKPFTRESLGEAVRSVLETARAA